VTFFAFLNPSKSVRGTNFIVCALREGLSSEFLALDLVLMPMEGHGSASFLLNRLMLFSNFLRILSLI
jgi:hypothetical protein